MWTVAATSASPCLYLRYLTKILSLSHIGSYLRVYSRSCLATQARSFLHFTSRADPGATAGPCSCSCSYQTKIPLPLPNLTHHKLAVCKQLPYSHTHPIANTVCKKPRPSTCLAGTTLRLVSHSLTQLLAHILTRHSGRRRGRLHR